MMILWVSMSSRFLSQSAWVVQGKDIADQSINQSVIIFRVA